MKDFEGAMQPKRCILINTYVAYSIGGGLGVFSEESCILHQNDIFVIHHLVGCHVCSAKRSSRFRDWRFYSHIESFEGVEFMVIKSGVICKNCYTGVTYGSIKVCANVRHVVYSCLFIFSVVNVCIYDILLSQAQQNH